MEKMVHKIELKDKDQLTGKDAEDVINSLLKKPSGSTEVLESVSMGLDETQPLQVVSLDQAHMILESSDDQTDDPPTMILPDGSMAFVQNLEAVEELDGSVIGMKFVDGQMVQLEDGSTALIHASPGEGLHPIQLEDGTMAYLSQTNSTDLLSLEAATLDLSNFTTTEENICTRTPSGRPGEKTFRCEFTDCDRIYTSLHHLKVHFRSHTGDRPYKCGLCPKAFATSYGMKSHVRVHTGETPYKCTHDQCVKAFKTSGDLQKHIRTHTGERPFKCSFEGCKRAFTTSNIRKVHIRTHTGERPYICGEEGCGRAFASATNYKNHIRIHTGEKPYVCSASGCSKRFTEYSSLYKHHVVHTHQKPYACSLCGRNYRQISTLTMHRRTTHGISDPLAEGEKSPEVELKDKDTLELEAATLSVDLKMDEKEDSSNESKEKDLPVNKMKISQLLSLQPGQASQLFQDNPVYTVQLSQDGTSLQQIVLVTDPVHLAQLQEQIASQLGSRTTVS